MGSREVRATTHKGGLSELAFSGRESLHVVPNLIPHLTKEG
jgi:hypothetical protein